MAHFTFFYAPVDRTCWIKGRSMQQRWRDARLCWRSVLVLISVLIDLNNNIVDACSQKCTCHRAELQLPNSRGQTASDKRIADVLLNNDAWFRHCPLYQTCHRPSEVYAVVKLVLWSRGLTWRSQVGASPIPIPTPLIWPYLGVK